MRRRALSSSSSSSGAWSQSDSDDSQGSPGGRPVPLEVVSTRQRPKLRGRKPNKMMPDDSEKSENPKMMFLFFGAMCFLFLFFILQSHGSSPRPSPALRSRGLEFDATPYVAPRNNLPHGGIKIPPNSIYKLAVEDVTGKIVSLFKYAGTVTLIVNVASLDGKTKINYKQLSDLQEKYRSAGFSVLAFPTKDFFQELSSNQEINEFVAKNFPQVSFPIFGLTSVKENPVYQELQRQLPHERVKHNFYKYLVDRNGVAVQMFQRPIDPIYIESQIQKLLGNPDESTLFD